MNLHKCFAKYEICQDISTIQEIELVFKYQTLAYVILGMYNSLKNVKLKTICLCFDYECMNFNLWKKIKVSYF